MTFFDYVRQQLALRRKRKELKRVEHWIWELKDQVAAGQQALHRAESRQAQLHAEIFALLPTDEIVRRGAQA